MKLNPQRQTRDYDCRAPESSSVRGEEEERKATPAAGSPAPGSPGHHVLTPPKKTCSDLDLKRSQRSELLAANPYLHGGSSSVSG